MSMWIPNSIKGWLFILFSAFSLSSCAEREEPYQSLGWDRLGNPEDYIEIPAIPAPEGSAVKVSASCFAEFGTRTRLGTDGASIIWMAGDCFRAQFRKGDQYLFADFVMEEKEGETGMFSTSSSLDGSDFICIYPGFSKSSLSKINGERIFRVSLPPVQPAMEGGFAEGLNAAMAVTGKIGAETALTFHNIPAMLKFRLSGDVVSRVKTVRLTTLGAIAGDAAVFNNGGTPALFANRFKEDVPSQSVTLTGSFKPGVDYYMVVWPKVMEGFEMEFSDEEGHSTTLRSRKTISLRRSTVTDLGTIRLEDDFKGAPPVSMDPVLYRKASAGKKPVTIAVIPEGFTVNELDQYERLAKAGIDFLFDTEPYRSYADHFNVYILKVASEGSGGNVTDGNGKVLIQSGCYFGTGWGENSYGDMRADDSRVFTFVSTNCQDIREGLHSINEVPVIMIVNDSRHAGRAIIWNSGRSYCMLSTCFGGNLCWRYPALVPNSESDPAAGYHDTTEEEYEELGRFNPGNWRNTLIHEFGHTFARLRDENWSSPVYANTSQIAEYQHWSVPFGLNISTTYTNPPWQVFLDRRKDMAACNGHYDRIGVFQGGAGALFGCWRSERASCMIDDRPYFSAWQRYLIVKRIMTLSGDLDSFSYDGWLSRDVTTDPLRDAATRTGAGESFLSMDARYYPEAGHVPPALLKD